MTIRAPISIRLLVLRAWAKGFFLALLLASLPALGASQLKDQALPEAVRGVWLTNVDSEVLNSRDGIEQAVALCADIGINSIFVVTWNKGYTLYPSSVMRAFSGVAMDPALDPLNTGRDPLRELIEIAHARGIKVFAWFEFGFAASHQQQGGHLVRRKPEWAALDRDGKLVTKNGFDWLNALDPQVQNFVDSLILEVVSNYQIDGIQGDDRLPALPSEAGYNPAVVAAYRESMGVNPPRDTQAPQWLDWRSEKLTSYARNLYERVKQEDPAALVSFAPSVYPWSKREYLQDWPAWLAGDSVDLLIPQVYRHDLASYRDTLAGTLAQVPEHKRRHITPGLLIKAGSQMPSVDFLAGMLKANRDAGLLGEVFFFYEGLHNYRELIRADYQARPVRFPDFQPNNSAVPEGEH